MFMDSSEEGELGTRKVTVKKKTLLRSHLEINLYIILRKKMAGVWKESNLKHFMVELGFGFVILPTNLSMT